MLPDLIVPTGTCKAVAELRGVEEGMGGVHACTSAHVYVLTAWKVLVPPKGLLGHMTSSVS